MSGSLEELGAAGWVTEPVFAAMCRSPSGRLSEGAFSRIRTELADRLRAALPADGVLLHLHGAACAVGQDDVEGNILELVRTELGFQGVLVVSLDLHANVTTRILQHADAVTAYRTMPHTDFVATGVRAARLLMNTGSRRSRTLAKIRALVPPTDASDVEGWFADLQARARQLELSPGIEEICLFPVQPWMDVADLGSSVVITGEDRDAGFRAALALANAWYDSRHAWRTGLRHWDEIRNQLKEKRSQPWLLVDSADATTGGSTGRSAEAVRELLPMANDMPGEIFLWVVDPAAVIAAERGDRCFSLGDQAIELSANVEWCGEGSYVARGRSYTGQTFSMGRAAVLSVGQLKIVVSTSPTFGSHPAFYECVNLSPNRALAVHVKSHMGWRAGFDADAGRGLIFDGPGCTTLNFARMPFRSKPDLYPISPEPKKPIELWQSS